MAWPTAIFLSVLVLTVGITASAFVPMLQEYLDRENLKQDQIEKIRDDASLKTLVNAL